MARSAEARKVLRDMDKQLTASSARSGRELAWSAQEAAVIAQISSILDRKAEFLALYNEETDTKVKLKLSAEIRLLEQAVARLIKGIETELPQPMSLRSVKASRAARARWDRSHAG